MNSFIQMTDGDFINTDHINRIRHDPQQKRAEVYLVDGILAGYIDEDTARALVGPRIRGEYR